MMENEFYNDEFEQLLREKADQFSMYPSKRVWHSIYNNLHPSRRWPSVVMSLLLISTLSIVGYLNTSDNSIIKPINQNSYTQIDNDVNPTSSTTATNRKQISAVTKTKQQPVTRLNNLSFDDFINQEPDDLSTYTFVTSNRPLKNNTANTSLDIMAVINDKNPSNINGKDLIEKVTAYIKSNKIYTDIAVANKKNKTKAVKPIAVDSNEEDETTVTALNITKPVSVDKTTAEFGINTLTAADKKTIKLNPLSDKKALNNEEKDWIENYASEYKSNRQKLKDRLSYQFYITPAVNYRKISSKVKGSATAFATADMNAAISQRPGFGFEAGGGIAYDISKNLQFKGGLQFNYTNYNIAADKTAHPIATNILLNDPFTGISYPSARTSTTSNVYNSTALQPVTLHNRTYQLSIPVGFAYKLSSEKNVDWYAGASAQPTYVFGGNAHIISSDLKNYISEPSSIRTWNLNLGFETYMNFKLGTYKLQVGPQVRYQVFSTYRKDVALIEKPYAVGLKLGLTKGF